MPLIRFSDSQLADLIDACRPLSPSARVAFLEAVAAELNRLPADQPGPGSIHRVVAALVPSYWDVPPAHGEARSRRKVGEPLLR